MQKTTITNNFEETRKLGKQFAKTLQGGEVLALHGDLGAGKTTFVQGLAQGLGITKKIISPTFIIVRTYEVRVKSQKSRIKNFYHVDVYRLENERDMKELGLLEMLSERESVIAIEWAEKMERLLPKRHIDVSIEQLENDWRKITVTLP